MRISVYRIDFHTVTKDEKGKEIRRTSPQRAVVAAKDLPDAIASLPQPPAGTENVLIQSHELYHGVLFGEGKADVQPQAIVRESVKAKE